MNMDFGWANVELFPAAPYSIDAASHACVLGLAFERQRGVHAIGGGRRQDFDAWPGDLAFTSPAVNIFSESMGGGEYLAVQVARNASERLSDAPLSAPRVVFHGHRRAVRLGAHLRLLMLASRPDCQRIEEQLALLLDCGLSLLESPPGAPGRYDLDRKTHARVLDYIDGAMDGSLGTPGQPDPLGLDALARLAGLAPLRFLRSFANAVGLTPHAYITERRLQRARALLRSTDMPVAAIAADCGFAHQSHLGAVLKQRVGLSPLEYRMLRGRAK